MEKKEKIQEILLPPGVSEEMLAVWKNRYRKVSSVTVVDGGECYTGFFHRPDMNTISAVTRTSQADEVKAANVLFDNCWLGGDAMMQEDAVIRMAAIGKLQELMNVSLVTLKNW